MSEFQIVRKSLDEDPPDFWLLIHFVNFIPSNTWNTSAILMEILKMVQDDQHFILDVDAVLYVYQKNSL